MLEHNDLQAIGQLMDEKLTSMELRMDEKMDKKMDEKIEGLAIIIKEGFDRTATKEDLEIVKNDLNNVKNNLEELTKTVHGIDFKLKRQLEISDDRLFEQTRMNKIYQRWFEKIAEKVGIQLDVPESFQKGIQ